MEHQRIKDLQIEESKKYSEKKPSSLKTIAWLYAVRKNKNYKKDTIHSGKWLLFVPRESIDGTWSIIKNATEQGLLGDASKVSTKLGHRIRAKNKEERVICVYTYDSTDSEDVLRIKNELLHLGLCPIHYKENVNSMR